MTPVGHPHLGPRRHWANQRSRPCHSVAWVREHDLAAAASAAVEEVAGAAAAVLPAEPRRALARLVNRLRRWIAPR